MIQGAINNFFSNVANSPNALTTLSEVDKLRNILRRESNITIDFNLGENGITLANHKSLLNEFRKTLPYCDLIVNTNSNDVDRTPLSDRGANLTFLKSSTFILSRAPQAIVVASPLAVAQPIAVMVLPSAAAAHGARRSSLLLSSASGLRVAGAAPRRGAEAAHAAVLRAAQHASAAQQVHAGVTAYAALVSSNIRPARVQAAPYARPAHGPQPSGEHYVSKSHAPRRGPK